MELPIIQQKSKLTTKCIRYIVNLSCSHPNMTTESLSQEDKANAWMKSLLADYELTDAQKKWWNATLDEATSHDMDQIVKLYESAIEICGQSLNPVMMRFVSEYWEGSYGQQKPEQLLLAAFRSGGTLFKCIDVHRPGVLSEGTPQEPRRVGFGAD
eukprot:scaffold9477_cov84-Skeletonema_dohrnii-CCMP3373.AAC.3